MHITLSRWSSHITVMYAHQSPPWIELSVLSLVCYGLLIKTSRSGIHFVPFPHLHQNDSVDFTTRQWTDEGRRMKILTFWKSGGRCNHDNDHHRKSILNIVTKAIPYIGYIIIAALNITWWHLHTTETLLCLQAESATMQITDIYSCTAEVVI